MNKAKKSTLEELMGQEEKEEMKAEDKADQITLDEPKKRTWLVVLVTVLITALVGAGGYVAWQSYAADKTLKAEEKIETSVVEKTETAAATPAASTEKNVYTTAPEGLNLRKEPKSDAEVLAIVPTGTKLAVLETSGDWYKTTYDSKTGWIAKLYTSDTDPLVYKNTTYGYGLTFPSTWGSYTVVKRDTVDAGATAYYDVFLATGDTSGLYPDGKSSMFVIGVYTPSQWTTVSAEEGPKPAVVKETAKYVYTYSPSQSAPEDLAPLRSDINTIIKTFIEL